MLVSQGQFPRLVLTDFGIAGSLEQPFNTLKGTTSYMPPEALTQIRTLLATDSSRMGRETDGTVIGRVQATLARRPTAGRSGS